MVTTLEPKRNKGETAKAVHHSGVPDDPIAVSDEDDGLGATLSELIERFNVDATGFDDGRLMRAAYRGADGSLEAGLAGWTWGGSGYVDHLWVRQDRRGAGLGSRLLEAAEVEAVARGCAQMIVSSHTFQSPDFYLKRGYVEYARTEDSPRGYADVHLVKDLAGRAHGGSHSAVD